MERMRSAWRRAAVWLRNVGGWIADVGIWLLATFADAVEWVLTGDLVEWVFGLIEMVWEDV
jgi:hypothetical protein